MTITPVPSGVSKRFGKLADTGALAIAHIGDCDAELGLATALTQIFQISHPFQSSTYHNGHMTLDTAKLTKCATMRGLASAQCLFGETVLHGVGGLAPLSADRGRRGGLLRRPLPPGEPVDEGDGG